MTAPILSSVKRIVSTCASASPTETSRCSSTSDMFALFLGTNAAERMIAGLTDESARRYFNPYEFALIYVGPVQNDQAFE